MSKLLKTKIHGYSFDIRVPEEAEAYQKLKETLKATYGVSHRFSVWRSPRDKGIDSLLYPNKTLDIELETKHLFHNQWNTAPIEGTGYRVFDWYQGMYATNKNLRSGHYLELTQEMVDIRDNTYQCGYCANQVLLGPDVVDAGFCHKCLGGEYLTEDQLYLLRMRPVSDDRREYQELEPEELQAILPLYREAQARRLALLAVKRKADLNEEYAKVVRNAGIKKTGFLAMLDAKLDIEDCIFYSHKGVFCFGWQKAKTEPEAKEILDKIRKIRFPYPVEVKMDTGTLSYDPKTMR